MAWKGWELVGLDDLGGGKPHPQIRRLWPVRHPWMPQLYPHPPVGKADAVPPVVPPRLVVVHQPDTVSLMPPEAHPFQGVTTSRACLMRRAVETWALATRAST